MFVEGALDPPPYLLAENKRGLAFPKRNGADSYFLCETNCSLEQNEKIRRGSEEADSNRTLIMRKAS